VTGWRSAWRRGGTGSGRSGRWPHERDELVKAEKEATRTLDELAARRRRLPMVRFGKSYAFDSPAGPRTLAGLFDGQDQPRMGWTLPFVSSRGTSFSE